MEHGSTSHCRDRVLPFSKTGAICWGTEGSNPSPSRRESAANLTPADAERPGRRAGEQLMQPWERRR